MNTNASMPSSESVIRVQRFLQNVGHPNAPITLADAARTAQQAADALGVALGQIAKSIVFKIKPLDRAVLVIASGDQRVDEKKVAALVCQAGQKLGRADADFVREKTGFAIGGVSPVGATARLTTIIDNTLFRFDTLWAAAGHPHTVFELTPAQLQQITSAPVADIVVNATPVAPSFNDSLDARWERAKRLQPNGVPSPCVGVCTMATLPAAAQQPAMCEGCLRTLPEIAKWGQLSDAEKRQMWDVLRAREAALF